MPMLPSGFKFDFNVISEQMTNAFAKMGESAAKANEAFVQLGNAMKKVEPFGVAETFEAELAAMNEKAYIVLPEGMSVTTLETGEPVVNIDVNAPPLDALTLEKVTADILAAINASTITPTPAIQRRLAKELGLPVEPEHVEAPPRSARKIDLDE